MNFILKIFQEVITLWYIFYRNYNKCLFPIMLCHFVYPDVCIPCHAFTDVLIWIIRDIFTIYSVHMEHPTIDVNFLSKICLWKDI